MATTIEKIMNSLTGMNGEKKKLPGSMPDLPEGLVRAGSVHNLEDVEDIGKPKASVAKPRY